MPTKNVIFVDSRVSNYQSLIDGLTEPAEVFVLDGASDGLVQMVADLKGRTGIDAIHVISHGSVGRLYLGSTVLDGGNLANYQSQLSTIGSALSESGDILLYGCNVAQSDHGVQFLRDLAQATGADVAASSSDTGARALGGDWVLERATGQIETTTFAVLNYASILAANTAPTFTVGDGKLTTAIGSSIDVGESVTLQADGKILVAGYSVIDNHTNFALVRYNSDGSLDTSFDVDGKVTTAIGTSSDYGKRVTLQPDGKILVMGYSYISGTGYDFALVRYNIDGSLDASFDGDGKLTTAISAGQDYARSVTLQADGKILVAGSSETSYNKFNFALVRYNIDGSLDTSFGGDGMVTTTIGKNQDFGKSVVRQADGKILVAGSSESSNIDFALVRYNNDGSLDTSFDGDGIVTTDFGASQDDGKGVLLQAGGKILVVGFSNGFALARYNSDGSLDKSFAGDGKKVTTALGDQQDVGFGFSIALQIDGKILETVNNNADFALLRYNPEGSLDTSFDGDGMVTTPIGTSADFSQSVTLQPNGKILVAGYSYTGSNQEDFALVRYNTDGSLDTTFSPPQNTLDSNQTVAEQSPFALAPGALIQDAELTSTGNYNGSTLTLSRQGGASPQDVFSAAGSALTALTAGSYFAVEGTTIGRVTANGAGVLTLAFNANATQALVNKAMQQIDYSNSSDAPPATVQINWTFNDGNTGAQGTGGAMSVTGSTMVQITAVNDAPILSVPLVDQTLAINKAFSYTVPANAFTDPDLDTLTYSVAMTDGTGMPPWLSFNAVTRTFSGTPRIGDMGLLDILVTAKDSANASVTSAARLYVSPPDTVPPVIVNFSPLIQRNGVAIDGNISFVFNEEIARGSGIISLKTTADNTVATYDAATSTNLSINNEVLTINPTADLNFNTGYKIEFANGAIKDLAGNSYVRTTTYNFNTASSEHPPIIGHVYSLNFEDPLGFAAGKGARTVVSADVNTDSNVDLIVTNFGSDTVSVLLGNSNGTYVKNDYATGSAPASVASSDLNGDGILDLFVVNYLGNSTSLLLGNGDGTFKETIDISVDPVAETGAAIDLNADGRIDMVVANGGAKVSVFISTGNGTFAPRVNYVTDRVPTGIVSGDVNGDGKVDLITSNWASSTVSVLLGNGDGTFSTKTDFPTGSGPWTVASSDLNGDGKSDLITSNYDESTVSILLASDGGFAKKVDYATGNRPFSVSIADVNGDGKTDLITTNRFASSVSVLLGSGNGTFAKNVDFSAGGDPVSVTSSDVNGDGKADLIVANAASGTTSVLLNSGLPSNITAFTEQSPIALAPTLIVSDTDGDWSSGQLIVQITENANAADKIYLSNTSSGGIWLDTTGMKLMFGTKLIGTANAESTNSGIAWTFTFNTTATNSLVQATAQSLLFNNASDVPVTGNRTVTFTAIDSRGLAGVGKQYVIITPVNDAPSGAVGVVGTPTQGLTLSATNTLADAEGVGAITYQWKSNGLDIAGAASNILLLTEAQVGKAISVTASYTDGYGTSESVTSNATSVVNNVNDAPTGTVSIAGSPSRDKTLTVSNTLADADGLGTITYQWKANGANIANATGSTCKLTQSEVGKTITVTASYTDGFGALESVSSAATGTVIGINTLPTGDVSISGSAVQGQPLSAVSTLADADGLGSLSYAWKANGQVIPGVTSSSFTPTESQVGKTITVTASYTDGHGTLETVTSPATLAVANVNDLPTGGVSITGAATQGQTLTATNTLADLDGLGTVSYQWNANRTAIADATSSTLALTEAQVGKTITVSASYTDGHGTVEFVSSAASVAVANVNDAPTGSVTITGNTTLGQVLTASNTLADLDGLGTISYQWSADGTAISGATSSTLTLADAQIGKAITVTASYSDGHGASESLSSNPTSAVTNIPPQDISGRSGNDTLTGGTGNDSLNGLEGTDTAVYTTRMAAYTITPNADKMGLSGPDGSDTLTSIERLQFLDANLAFDLDTNAGQVYRLYQAAFNRTPDLSGLGGWIAAMDDGMPLLTIASKFMESAEFQSLYGGNPTNAQFVANLYTNALHRPSQQDAGSAAGWVNQLASNTLSKAQALVNFSESAENKASVLPVISGGITYANASQGAGPAKGQSFAGTPNTDSLIGTVGNDTFTGGAGNDTIEGGKGLDTAVYSGAKASHTIARTATGLTVAGGSAGTDTLSNVERLKFDDAILAMDTAGNAGQTYRLYQAAFNRTPDKAGLSDWVKGMDTGLTLTQMATAFIGSGEFKGKYGENPTNAQFVDLLYTNALHRARAAGDDYWTNQLDSGVTREQALIGFSESAENQASLIGVIQNGIELAVG